MKELEELKEKILARPDQTLFCHLKNILTEFNHTFDHLFFPFQHSNNEKEQAIKTEIGQLFLRIFLAFHDFGKINPFFQIKIDNKVFTSRIKTRYPPRKFCFYHAQISGIFFFIITNKFIEELSTWLDERGVSLNDLKGFQDELRNFQLMLLYGIMYHHQRGNLPNGLFATIAESGDQFQFADLINIIETIKNSIPNIELNLLNLFCDLLEIPKESRFYNLLKDSLHLLLTTYTIEDFKDIAYNIEDSWDKLKEEINLLFLLYYYSILCDLDEWDAKSHIVNSVDHSMYFALPYYNFSNELIEHYRNRTFAPISLNTQDPLLQIKQSLWDETNNPIFHRWGLIINIQYPTGSGKTLAYLNLAMKIRHKYESESPIKPKIIYCLPFISITDQVGDVTQSILNYMLELLTQQNENSKLDNVDFKYQNEILTIHHHLAESNFTYITIPEEDEMNIYPSFDDIYLWKSNIIITTFVGFWNSILAGTKHDALKFHRIMGSIIILDEIQNLPLKYWKLISKTLHILAKQFRCTIIVGSATNPQAITYPFKIKQNKDTDSADLKEIKLDYSKLPLDRYNLIYRPEKIPFTKFLEEFLAELENLSNFKLMLVLNTRKAARYAFDYLKQHLIGWDILFLSSAVRYCDRLEIIQRIREIPSQIILICTQVIEAGVDLSFDYIFRDIAPLDSIIQIAGRCNRYNDEEKHGSITIIDLENDLEPKKPAFSRIYDEILLNFTRTLLKQKETLSERELYSLINQYYHQISLSEQPKKKIDFGLNYFNNCQLSALSKEFQLIEEQESSTLFLIENEEEFRKIREELSDLTKSHTKILHQYRAFSFSIPDKILQGLKKVFANESEWFFEYTHPKQSEHIYFCLLEEHSKVYQKNGGLALSLL